MLNLSAKSQAAQAFNQRITFQQIREMLADIIAPEMRERRNLAERAANTDALTRLPNRRAFDLAQAAASRDATLSFVLFDANNFGLCNKIKGHAAGDSMLQSIAASLSTAAGWFGAANRVFRLGGDEFIVICSSDVAPLLRDAAEQLFGRHEIAPNIFISISGTVGCSIEDADSRLQQRKSEQKAIKPVRSNLRKQPAARPAALFRSI